MYVCSVEDIDECKCKKNGGCAEKAKCVNTVGSFYCKCKKGYCGDPYTSCKKIPKSSGTVFYSEVIDLIRVRIYIVVSCLIKMWLPWPYFLSPLLSAV